MICSSRRIWAFEIADTTCSRMRASFAAALGGLEHEFVVIRDARCLAEAYARAAELPRLRSLLVARNGGDPLLQKTIEAVTRAARGGSSQPPRTSGDSG